MVEISVTKMSSKGQIVIPIEIRENIKEGDKLILIRNKDQIIIKKADKFDKNIKEDLEFAKRTEEAYKRIESGEYISIDSENLFEEMEKW